MEVVFNKTLTKSHVSAKLDVPAQSLGAFAIPQTAYEVDFNAIDINGHTWTFRLYTRRAGYAKPVLSAGWPAFVQRKGLRMGDKVILFKEANEVQFRIRAERKLTTRLFGNDLWVNVEDWDQYHAN